MENNQNKGCVETIFGIVGMAILGILLILFL